MDSKNENMSARVPDAYSLAAKSRKLHYSFAYRMLPLMIFGQNGQSVFDLLADPDQAREYLLEAWERTAESQDLELFNPEGLGTTYLDGEELETVVVYMPEPLYPPEAYYVIIQREKDGNKLHFFTVELSVRLDGTKRVVLGKYQPGGGRHNLGALISAGLESCLEEIDRKKAHIFPLR